MWCQQPARFRAFTSMWVPSPIFAERDAPWGLRARYRFRGVCACATTRTARPGGDGLRLEFHFDELADVGSHVVHIGHIEIGGVPLVLQLHAQNSECAYPECRVSRAVSCVCVCVAGLVLGRDHRSDHRAPERPHDLRHGPTTPVAAVGYAHFRSLPSSALACRPRRKTVS